MLYSPFFYIRFCRAFLVTHANGIRKCYAGTVDLNGSKTVTSKKTDVKDINSPKAVTAFAAKSGCGYLHAIIDKALCVTGITQTELHHTNGRYSDYICVRDIRITSVSEQSQTLLRSVKRE